MSWMTQMWRCRTIKSVLCIQCFTQLTPLTSKSHLIYTVDSNTKFLNYMKIWLKALSYNKLWNNSLNVNTDEFHCRFLFSVLVSKQETCYFALLGKEFNPFKGEAALFVRTEAKITMLFHCLFGLRCCSKQELHLWFVSAIFFVIISTCRGFYHKKKNKLYNWTSCPSKALTPLIQIDYWKPLK